MSSAVATDPLASGTVLADKYRVVRVLGEGGMGVVVEAMHMQLDERVAIKFLRPEAMKHAPLVTRFAREARAMIKIKSEHVARVIDVGTLDTGAPYMVMEYLEGMDLDALITLKGGLPLETAVDFILQASEALAEAHMLGIIHRDLKPSNLFLTTRADGSACLKVLDFGISKIRSLGSSQTDVALTQTSALLGSPLYMAPEQMTAASEVDARTDIWALGVILFELLAGRPPFPGENLPELQARIIQGDHLQLEAFRDDLPDTAIQVVMRCLQLEPSKRFEDLAQLADALLPFGSPEALVSAQRVRRLSATKKGDVRPSASAAIPATTPMSIRLERSPGPGELAKVSPSPAAASIALQPTVRAPEPNERKQPRTVAVGVAAVAAAILLAAGLYFGLGATRPRAQTPSPQAVATEPVSTPQGSAPSTAEAPSAAGAASEVAAAPTAAEPRRSNSRDKPAKTAASTTAPRPPDPPTPTGPGLFDTRK